MEKTTEERIAELNAKRVLIKSWTDEKSTFPCLIIKQEFGYLCGYIGIPSSHPLADKQNELEAQIDVHGGVTFAKFWHPWEMRDTFYTYWVGFDCAHCFDIMPDFPVDLSHMPGASFKTPEFVELELESMGEQLCTERPDPKPDILT